jgi:hypothetical protein
VDKTISQDEHYASQEQSDSSINQRMLGKDNLELFLKIIPISMGLIYITGYLIALLYFRSIKIQNIDLLEASLFETGITFYLLSFTLIGALMIIPTLLVIARKGSALIPYQLGDHLIGVIFSVITFLIVYFSSVYITLFLTPGEFSHISSYFFKLLTFGVIGFTFLIIVNVITKKLTDDKIITPDGKIKEGHIYKATDILRVILFIIVLCYWYKIFIASSGVLIPVFSEINIVYYLIFLFLFFLLSVRLFSHLISPESHSKYAIILLSPLAATFFYLTIISYVYGPFPYIPSSRGGSWNLQSVSIISDDKALINDSILFDGSNISKKAYLVAENDSSIYVAVYTAKKTPQDLFSYLRNTKIIRIPAKSIKELIYNNDTSLIGRKTKKNKGVR